MLVELYSYLSNLPRYHVFFVVSVGYLGYYLLEVVKVSQLNTKVQKRDVPRSAIMQVTLRLSIITHFDFLELITRSVLIRFSLSNIYTSEANISRQRGAVSPLSAQEHTDSRSQVLADILVHRVASSNRIRVISPSQCFADTRLSEVSAAFYQ